MTPALSLLCAFLTPRASAAVVEAVPPAAVLARAALPSAAPVLLPLGAPALGVFSAASAPVVPPSAGAAPAAAAVAVPAAVTSPAALPRYDKLSRALFDHLRQRGYSRAIAALEFARGRHVGRRKDGITPEFQHQVEIALYLTTLRDLPDEELTLTTALLHDVIEDYDVPPEEIEALFGADVRASVWRLTKVYRGVKKEPAAYFAEIGRDPVASLVKGADRIHNLQSMVGVFPLEKQREYADEAERWFLPMLKDASRRFPAHAAAYHNVRHLIRSQLALIRAAIIASELVAPR